MTIHILLTLNNAYLEPSIVTLNSLFSNNRTECFHIHIIHYDLTIESQNKLYSFVTKNASLCSFYMITDIEWANGKTRYWDKIILLKLFAWQVIPPPIKRVIYLDSDVVVLGSIRELWDLQIGNHYFVMRGNTELTDLSGVYAKHSATGHTNYVIKRNRYDIHYNAGVIVMNLDILRNENPQWKQFFLANYYRLFCPEEHLIGMLWYERILQLEDKWNHIAQAHSYTKPIIIHYIPKPWSDNREPYYLQEYLQYCDIPECNHLYNKLLPRINATYPHSKEAFLSSWFHLEILYPMYLQEYLSKHHYKTIAIYGINTCTEILICKISTQDNIKISYFIDNNVDYREYNNLLVYKTDELMNAPTTDCIIISDYEHFLEIEARLHRINNYTPIVSLIELIYS
ncbi:MAG: hypothetical protein J6T37_04080 [Bacteroidales bacterium]|nr:hypothetical protein [Bacteroidales bacterium]